MRSREGQFDSSVTRP
nr:unnamed protein product [Callosobruchus chinensis]